MSILVLGLGNILLSDEGVGVRIVEALDASHDLPGEVDVLDGGTSGMDLLDMVAERDCVIVADAVHVILNRPARECTGQFFIDDSVLYEAGVRDFDPYSVEPGGKLLGDIFIDATSPAPPGVQVEFMR